MTVSVAVFDEGANSELVDYLKSIENYNIVIVDSAERSVTMVEGEDVAAAIIIPDDFSNDIKIGIKPSLKVLINPYDINAIVFSQSYKDVIMDYMEADYPVDISLEMTSTHSQSQFNVPTWILFATIFVGISVLPNTFTVEKEKKTFDAIMVTPASEFEVIFGKSLFGLCLTILMSLFVMYINNGFIGNIPLVLLFIIVGSTAFTGLGLFVSSYVDSYSSASIISTILMMPLLLLALLSDLSTEIEMVAHLVPSTYMLDGINSAMFNNATISGTYMELLVLVAFNIVVYVLAIYTIKKRRYMAN
jgi:ABC-2 type transport system permease protein